MFKKDQVKALKTEFWTALATHMLGKKPRNIAKIRFLNYKTGIKDFYIRMHAEKDHAMVSFDFQHKDEEIRALFYEQLESFKTMMHSTMETELIWDPEYIIDRRYTIARVYLQLDNVNVFNKEDWPAMFEFLTPLMFKADEFWEDVKDVFQDLAK